MLVRVAKITKVFLAKIENCDFSQLPFSLINLFNRKKLMIDNKNRIHMEMEMQERSLLFSNFTFILLPGK